MGIQQSRRKPGAECHPNNTQTLIHLCILLQLKSTKTLSFQQVCLSALALLIINVKSFSIFKRNGAHLVKKRTFEKKQRLSTFENLMF
jgi:hypothetical protein